MNENVPKIIRTLADQHHADFYLYSGTIDTAGCDDLIEQVREKDKRRENIAILISTFGGSPDAGYRLVRTLKRFHKRLHLYVFGFCKSAGTLIALGADRVVMGDFGELGPLDIQVSKDDELALTSGLTYHQALLLLSQQAFSMFESHFLQLKERSGGNLTTKTAAEIAARLTVEIISPISSHIDPQKLGEVGRASRIGMDYGRRLSSNQDAVRRLVGSYPSHGFVIDFEEARSLLGEIVTAPEGAEIDLEREFLKTVRHPSLEQPPTVVPLTPATDEAPANPRSARPKDTSRPKRRNANHRGNANGRGSSAATNGTERSRTV